MFPIGDWQFWAATAVFVVAAGFVLRTVMPGRLGKRKPPRARRATLTVGGKPVGK